MKRKPITKGMLGRSGTAYLVIRRAHKWDDRPQSVAWTNGHFVAKLHRFPPKLREQLSELETARNVVRGARVDTIEHETVCRTIERNADGVRAWRLVAESDDVVMYRAEHGRSDDPDSYLYVCADYAARLRLPDTVYAADNRSVVLDDVCWDRASVAIMPLDPVVAARKAS